MIIISSTDFHIEEECAVAIGKFDGVHLGHQILVRQIVAAKAKYLKSVVFTFDPPSHIFFAKEGLQIKDITTKEEKRRIFEGLGVDYLIEFPFNETTSKIKAEDFVSNILRNQLNMKFIVAGEDISFGYKGLGDLKLLKELGKKYNFKTKFINKITYRDEVISSSSIRKKLEQGKMEEVSQLLGRNYSIYGEVVRGNQIGRTIQMPTANVIPTNEKCMPPNGVYFSIVSWNGAKYNAITNIGYKPTVSDDNQITVETYLFGIDADLYSKKIEIALLHYKRGEKKFESLAELKTQIMKDKKDAEIFFRHKI